MSKIKTLAFYLPQYHPIRENDEWWGKGFTEWTNVGKAKPLFRGHEQPICPGDLGYYDLRVPEVREQQAAMAKEYGVDGFIYYHYWFGNGKQLLERIANEILASGKPDFPFCFCWANETWSGIWHGLTNKILAEQTYPMDKDIINHFNYLLPFFQDERYIKIDGKPLFMIYDGAFPSALPVYMKRLNELAIKAGLEGIHFMASNRCPDNGINYQEKGFDSKISFAFNELFESNRNKVLLSFKNRLKTKLSNILGIKFQPMFVFESEQFFEDLKFKATDIPTYPIVVPNWDNSPRSGKRAVILKNSNARVFEKQVEKAVDYLEKQNFKESFLFVKSWNEWAEGNYLEPDNKHKFEFLEVVKKFTK